MKIKSNNNYNSGGGCMLKELMIEGGGELQSITITAEAIVGNRTGWYDSEIELDHEENTLWIAMDRESLNEIPELIRAEVIEAYNSFCKQFHDHPQLTAEVL